MKESLLYPEEDQRKMLRTGSKQVRRVANLLRSVNPESFAAAERAKQLREQAWSRRSDTPTVEEVVKGFADMLRYGPTIGPGTQDLLRSSLEPLIARMGLTCEVYQALEAPGDRSHIFLRL